MPTSPTGGHPANTSGRTSATNSSGSPLDGRRRRWPTRTGRLSAGGTHTCARRASRLTFCLGLDDAGRVGRPGGTADQPTRSRATADRRVDTRLNGPTEAPRARSSVGHYRRVMRSRRARFVVVVLAVAGGLLVGNDPSGGPGAPTEGGTPDWRSVSAGRFHTCGIRTTGRLYCWGSDLEGQLGNAGGEADQAIPDRGGRRQHRLDARGRRRRAHLRAAQQRPPLLLGTATASASWATATPHFGADPASRRSRWSGTRPRLDSSFDRPGRLHTCGRRSHGPALLLGAPTATGGSATARVQRPTTAGAGRGGRWA